MLDSFSDSALERLKLGKSFEMKKIHILLPVHNRIEITKKFIKNLKAQTYSNFQLILIDDGSTDGTANYVQNELAEAVIITGKGDLWWGGSLHKGYLWLKESNIPKDDLVLIINDDTDFAENYLEKAVEIFNDQKKILIGSYCYSSRNGKLIDRGVQWNWKTGGIKVVDKDEDINCLSTRGLFLRVDDFLSLKGFYPKTLPHYLSDYEFTIRAKKKGMKLVTNSNLIVKTDDTPAGIAEFDYSSWKNFAKKYFSYRNYAHPVHKFFFILYAWDGGIKYRIKAWIHLFQDFFSHLEKVSPALKGTKCSIYSMLRFCYFLFIVLIKCFRFIHHIFSYTFWHLKVLRWEVLLFLRYFGSKFNCSVCDGRFRKLKEIVSDTKEVKYYCPRCGMGAYNRFVFQFLRSNKLISNGKTKLLYISSEKGLGDRLSKIKDLKFDRAKLLGGSLNSEVRLKSVSKKYLYNGVLGIDILNQYNVGPTLFRDLYRSTVEKGWLVLGLPDINFDQESKIENDLTKSGFKVSKISFESLSGNYFEPSELSEKTKKKSLLFCQKSF